MKLRENPTEPEGIRTPDPRLRRPLLYPAELQTHSVQKMRSFHSTKRVMGIEPTYPAWKAGVLPLNYTRIFNCSQVGVTGFEPATSWSQTRRSSQAEPHPGISYVPVSPVAQCLLYYKVFRLSIFFLHFFIFLMTFYFILFLHAISRLLLCRTFRQSKYF